MKRTGAVGGMAVLLSLTNACSSVSEEGTHATSEPATGNVPTPGLHELSSASPTIAVRNSSASLHLKRAAKLSYEVSYVTPDGESHLLVPAPEHAMNPIVDARSHGDRTIACVSSFGDLSGASSSVECMLLETTTGRVLDRTVVANAWLRTLPGRGVGAYVSPGGPARFEPNGWVGCRAISIDESGTHLAYDPDTVTACDETPARVARDKVLGPRRPSLRPVVTALADTKLAAVQPALAPAKHRVTPALHRSKRVPSGVSTAGYRTANATVEEELAEEFESGCGGPLPTSKPVTARLGPPAIPGLDRIASGFTIPDWIREGWTLGATLDVRGEMTRENDLPLCVNDSLSEWASAHASLSAGPVVGSLNVDYSHAGSNCDTLDCRNGNGEVDPNGEGFACGAPGGVNETKSWNLSWTLGGSIPLDTIPLPPLRLFCSGLPGYGFLGVTVIPPLGVSCNLDLMGSGGFSESNSHASGKSMCGSSCEDGRATSYVDKRENFGFEGSLEFEVAFGVFGNGRAGISYEYSKSFGDIDEVSCTDAHTETFLCSDQRVTAYARGCAGNSWASYCFDITKTLYRDHQGDCPAPPDPYQGGISPGTAAGQACANTATDFWTWTNYADQCRECCNHLPAIGESPATFDAECKAVCESL